MKLLPLFVIAIHLLTSTTLYSQGIDPVEPQRISNPPIEETSLKILSENDPNDSFNPMQSSVAISQTIVNLQQRIKKMQTELEEARSLFQKQDSTFKNEILKFKTADEVSIEMLENIEDQRAEAMAFLEGLRLEQKTVETDLKSQTHYLQQLQKKLSEINQHDGEEKLSEQATTDLKVAVSALENNISLQTSQVNLQSQLLDLLKKRIELAERHLKLMTDWNDKLQGLYWTKPSLERQRIIQEAQNTLKRKQEVLQANQRDLPNQIANLESLQTSQLLELFEKVTLEKEGINVEVDNLRLERQNTEGNVERQRSNLKALRESLDGLRKYPPSADNAEQRISQSRQIAEIENKITLQKKLLDLEEQYLGILKQRVELSRQSQTVVTTWHDAVQKVAQLRKKQDLEGLIQSRTAPYLSRLTEVRQQLEGLEDQSQRSLLEAQAQEIEAQIQQVIYELKLTHLQDQIQQLEIAKQNATQLHPGKLKIIQGVIKEFVGLQMLLKNKLEVLKQQQDIIQKRGKSFLTEDNSITEANHLLKNRAQILQQLLEKGQLSLLQGEKVYSDYQREMLFSARNLPKEVTEWQNLLNEVKNLPYQFLQQLQFTWFDLQQTARQLSSRNWLLISLLALLWLGLFVWVRGQLIVLFERLNGIEVRSFLANGILVGLKLLHLSGLWIALSGILLLFMGLAKPADSSMMLVLSLIFTGLGAKLLINLAWLLLSDKALKTPNRSKVYVQICWTVIIMSVFTLMTTWVHINYEKFDLNISLNIQQLMDSLFMLLLSLVVWPVIRIRRIFLDFLEDRVKSYWFLVIQLITLLFPLSILMVALLGVVGYLNLGWRVGEQSSWFVLVLTGLLIAQGILSDGIIWLKNFALKHSRYGLLWTQDIIPLLHKLLGIVLIGVATVIFLWLSGWLPAEKTAGDVAMRETVEKVLTYSLFTLGSSDISLGKLVLFALTLWGVFWFGRWCRQVTYRWIYIGVIDLGVRHSLSVFTQYTVVLVGLFVSLRIVGIDLTTLTIFAGALGVGIGFGLQNIVNNFISGILLLIERPLRTGDLISVGGKYEGIVSEIGIRSLTLRTFDYDEVIIPNADFISQAFTNWTHTNQFKRTTVYINVSYETDLDEALAVITGAIQEVTDIVKDPAYQVVIWEFADSAVSLRVDYYIDLSVSGIVPIRGQLMNVIWKRLQAHGIKIPYPQQDVYVKSAVRLEPSEVSEENQLKEGGMKSEIERK